MPRGLPHKSDSVYRKVRKHIGLTQREVAERLNTTQGRISKLESKPHCKIGELVELAELGGKKLSLNVVSDYFKDGFDVEMRIRLN
jgi:transcriptional regulator with XRE-family HTH domain